MILLQKGNYDAEELKNIANRFKGRVYRMLSTLTELVISLILEDQSSLRKIDHDGNPVNLTGTATDVLHQQSDGTWRIVIDNPWGTV